MERRFVSAKETASYALAAGGQTLSSSFLGLYVTYFFVSIFNIDASLVASVLFFIGVWDAVNDPMMGAIIDKTRTRFGKLKPYLLLSPLPLMITTILLFAGPLILGNEDPQSAKKVVYMTLTYFIVELFSTMADVPLWGLSASASPNLTDRSYMISYARFSTYLIGNIPTIAVPIFIDLSISGTLGAPLKQVFFVMATAFAVIGMGLYALGGLAVKERIAQSEEKPRIVDSLKYLVTNKYLLLIVAYNLLSALCNFAGIFTTYYYIDVLGSLTISLLIGTPGTILGFVSYLIVPRLQKRFTNKQLLCAAVIWNAISFSLLFFIGRGRADNMALMVPALMIQGFSTSMFLGVKAIIPTELICETIDYMEWKTDVRSEGMTFSALNLITKLGSNIARSIGLKFLSAIGYVSSNTDIHAVQSVRTKNGIWMMYTIVPYLMSVVALIPLIFYDLSGKKLNKINAELEERRALKSREMEFTDAS